MNLAYPFLTEETKKPLLGYKGNTKEVFSLLKRIGYTGIELLIRDPKEVDISLLYTLTQQLDLQIVAVGTGPVVSDDRLTFMSDDDDTRIKAIKRAKDIIEFASQFNCPVSIGKLRGELDKENPKQSWEWLDDALKQVTEHAERYKIDIMLEPQSKSAMNNLNTTLDALFYIHLIDIPNLKLMLDVYHMNAEHEPIKQRFREVKDYLIYLHVADSNRQSPGKGTFDYKEVINTLHSLDYNGFITPEISQGLDSYTEAKAAFDYLNQIIKEKNIV
ncbi:sugar phosphate isomerase/epimerase family protein [Priestia endophytica]|uniref:Xylose isomerase-like TIM barrel domain-containing protein n=1 Tax=Priestia endophytica TaxID=135735 RepID=A0AAX1Q6B0_9BACI|nr:sugar phosphate isomerase/epimerase family protein [Priestia endophytica]RAS75530.1 hypothetical protein A3864_15730 [Priestia endophytica]RAS91224.1 hypothetical protein A3863_06565 [Priestia endophytica]